MRLTPEQQTKVEELRIRLSATIHSLKNTAAVLRQAAIKQAKDGETFTAGILTDIADQFEDIANGREDVSR